MPRSITDVGFFQICDNTWVKSYRHKKQFFSSYIDALNRIYNVLKFIWFYFLFHIYNIYICIKNIMLYSFQSSIFFSLSSSMCWDFKRQDGWFYGIPCKLTRPHNQCYQSVQTLVCCPLYSLQCIWIFIERKMWNVRKFTFYEEFGAWKNIQWAF